MIAKIDKISNNNTDKSKNNKKVNSEYLKNEVDSLYSMLGLNSKISKPVAWVNDSDRKPIYKDGDDYEQTS